LIHVVQILNEGTLISDLLYMYFCTYYSHDDLVMGQAFKVTHTIWFCHFNVDRRHAFFSASTYLLIHHSSLFLLF